MTTNTSTSKASAPSLTSQLGLSLAQKQTTAMTPAPVTTTPTSTTPPAATPNAAGTTTNTQTGQVFQNATTGPYTQANANSIASNPTYQAPATTLGQPIQPLSYFMTQNGGNRQAALSAFQSQRKTPTSTDNYNNGLKALGGVTSYLNQEAQKQTQRNEVKFAQDAQDQMNQLNTQHGLQTQMNDISYQNQQTQAQNNLDRQKQAAAYLAGGVGQPGSSVGLAGQQKDIQDASDFLANLGISHNLQNSYNANNLAYQVKDIRKQIDLNVSSAVQNALVQVGKLDSMGDLNSVESVLKARKDIMDNLTAIRQQMVDQNVPYLKALMDEDIKNHTVDQSVTSQYNDGTLYNAQGTPILSKNGQPLKVANYTGKLLSQSPITLSDGSSALVYQNTDGTLRTEKIKDTGTMLSDDSINTFAKMVASGRASLSDIPKGLQDAVLSRMNSYNSSGALTIGSGNLSGSELMKALASGTYNGTKFFGLYASGDPTGANRANIYDKAQNIGLDAFVAQYKGTPITPQMITASATKFGVDPLMVATIMAADSSMGTNWYGKGRGLPQNNNPGNVGQNDTDSKNGVNHGIATMEEGIDAVSKNLQHRLQALQSKLGGTANANTNASQFSETEINQFKNYNGNTIPEEYKYPDQKAAFLARRDAWLKTAPVVDTLTQQDKSNIAGLADDFRKEPAVTEFKKVAGQRAWIQNIDNTDLSSSDQMGLISNYAKVLDPNSVVKDSEYATSAKYSQSTIEAKAQEIKHFFAGGGTLSKEGQTMLKEAIKKRFGAMEQAYNDEVNAYKTQMKYRVGKDLPVEALTGYSDTPTQQTVPGTTSSSSNGVDVTVQGNTVSTKASNGKTYSIPL